MKLVQFNDELSEMPVSHYVVGISGVSGAGKTTLIQRLILEQAGQAGYVTSLTTRPYRKDDSQDEYDYISDETFNALDEKGFATWKVGAHGKYYGNTYEQFVRALTDFRVSLIAITPETILKISEILPQERLQLFHVAAPSEKEQRRRLKLRGESDETIRQRIRTSRNWEHDVREIMKNLPGRIRIVQQDNRDAMFAELKSTLDLPT